MNYKEYIRDIKDFPKKGIVFKDITPLLKNARVFKACIKEISLKHLGQKIDYVVGIESRGFIFGAPLAFELDAGFIPVRKPGKLPYKTLKKEFKTEYSTDAVEIHIDAIKKGDNVIIVDDLLATGGIAKATKELVEKLGGNIIEICFLIKLSFLKPKLKYKTFSLIEYK